MIFCNEKVYAESRAIWRNVLARDSADIKLEILSKKKTPTPAASLLNNSMIVTVLEQSVEPIHELLLLIVSTKHLVEASLNPEDNFIIIKTHVDSVVSAPNASNIVLFLLAEMLQITSIVHIPQLLEILEILIVKKKLGHPLIHSMVLDFLIQVLAFPSFAKGKLLAVERIMCFIQNNKKHTKIDTASFSSPFISRCADLLNARDVSIMLETRPSFKFSVISTNGERFFWMRNQLVLRGFLQSDLLDLENWNIALSNLISVVVVDNGLKSSLVMPLLFKLSSSSNPRIKLSILQNIIQLGATPEVFSTIKALSNGIISSMSIDLHLRLWKIEPRTYPFLHKSLVDKRNHTDDVRLEIVRASAVREICNLRPQHGSDLVSLISEILNNALDSKEGEIAAAIAIDSIRLLCQNHICSVVSTWKAIGLKTRYEKRPRVVQSLCRFFALVPSLKRNTLDYENLMKEIVGRLWNLVEWGNRNEIESALKALKSWNYDAMTLDTIPVAYREGIALHAALAGTEISILDLEVPGECFVQLLVKVHPEGLQAAGDLLAHYIGCEIAEFRSGHYLVKEGTTEPVNYKNLPKQSILKALTAFVIQQATTRKAEKLVGEAVLVEALRILAMKFPRPLPPLNWCFLHDLLHKSDAIKVECLRIAAKQAIISGTAKRLIENFLVNLDSDCVEDIKIALNVLADLCNGVSPEILKAFCEYVFLRSQRDVADEIANCLRLQKEISNHDNLATVVAVYVTSQATPVSVIKIIPPKILDAIAFQLNARKKIGFRCEILKVNSGVENPIAWINELINEQLLVPDNREYFIDVFKELLISSDSFPKQKWIIDLITQTQNRMVDTSFEDDKIKFLVDIFAISVVVSSGYFKVLVEQDELIAKCYQVFPSSVELVSRQSAYSESVMPSIFEFLLHVTKSESAIPAEIRIAFTTAVVVSKNHFYFKKPKVWQKFLMMK